MDIFSAGLEGLRAAESKVDATAARLSRAGLPANGTQPADQVDLSTEVVNLLSGKLEYEANLKSLETGAEMAKHTLDILG